MKRPINRCCRLCLPWSRLLFICGMKVTKSSSLALARSGLVWNEWTSQVSLRVYQANKCVYAVTFKFESNGYYVLGVSGHRAGASDCIMGQLVRATRTTNRPGSPDPWGYFRCKLLETRNWIGIESSTLADTIFECRQYIQRAFSDGSCPHCQREWYSFR